MKILVVDDEKLLVKGMKFNLENEGYEVMTAYDGAAAVELEKKENFDLIVMDVMMPGLSGSDACMKIREFSDVPVIMLTARSEDSDKLMGFACGADDYVTKPFSFREMVSRVRAQLRRTQWEKDDPTVRRYGKLTIFLNEHRAAADGKTLNLSPKEYDILCKLMEKPNWVVTREQLLSSIWGDEYEGEMRTVDMHMTNLRRKLDEAGAKDYIQTVRAVGYKMKPLEEKAE